MDQIGLFFKCQSCSDYVLTSNIQCPNGHQVCKSCYENLSHCQTCQHRVAPSTRIPFLITSNLDPILNIGESFDLLLPSLLRIAPALHPCSAEEMIYAPNSIDQNTNEADSTSDHPTIGQEPKTSLTDEANNGEIEETLSRLMMLASMSSPPLNSNEKINQ